MSLLILIKEKYYCDVNVRDNFLATPLHFAILKQEFMNVQLLIKFGADVNAQDQMGLAPLHICIMRIGQCPDNYDDYKKIVKELLFSGANRTLVNEQGHTPRDMLEEIEDELEEAEYEQMKSILTFKRPCLCFMRRRPIQKMERSYWTMIFGIVFTGVSTTIYFKFINEKYHHADYGILLKPLHVALWWMAVVLLFISVPLFVLTVTINPGHLKPFYDYTKLIEVAFDIGLHLENFCTHCEVIKSETSFHCTICGKCVELFDHHCPFINNCLGHNNHKYFILFIVSFMCYLVVLMTETIRHFAEIYKEQGIKCLYTDCMSTVNLILITLHFPIMLFQIYNQCRNLNKKP